jgi:hypothetical protein
LSSQWQQPYGDSFRYQEFWDSVRRPAGRRRARGIRNGFLSPMMRLPGVGRFVEARCAGARRRPSEETMDNGFYECHSVGTLTTAPRRGRASPKGDPAIALP